MAVLFLWVVITVFGMIVIISYKSLILFLKSLLWLLVIGIPEKLMPWIVLGAEKRKSMKREMKAAGTYPSFRNRIFDFGRRLIYAIIETFTEPFKEIKESVLKKNS